jgi:hypothetical protein
MAGVIDEIIAPKRCVTLSSRAGILDDARG